MFCEHRSHNNKTIWRCERRLDYNAILHSDSNKHQILQETEHTHPPDWDKSKATEMMEGIEDEVETSNKATSSIINRSVSNVPREIFMKLPKTGAIRLCVERVRERVLPSNPKSLLDLQCILNQFKVDTDNNNWLLKFNANSKLIVFTKRSHLMKLNRSPYWICDRTF